MTFVVPEWVFSQQTLVGAAVAVGVPVYFLCGAIVVGLLLRWLPVDFTNSPFPTFDRSLVTLGWPLVLAALVVVLAGYCVFAPTHWLIGKVSGKK